MATTPDHMNPAPRTQHLSFIDGDDRASVISTETDMFTSPQPDVDADTIAPVVPDDGVHSVKLPSQRTSQATLTASALPDGCSYGEIPSKDEDGRAERVIWVDFPPGSPDNPFYFTTRRKLAITACALYYSAICSATASAFSIQVGAMCDALGCSPLEGEAGIALYAWGAGVMPLFVAPVSEEFGRRPVYIAAAAMCFAFHLAHAVGQNTATLLVSRFLVGCAGSIGTSVVGGTISDIFIPAHRGLPMALSGFSIYFFTGLGGIINAYVVVRLSWRWVWWILSIATGLFVPVLIFAMNETRSDIILRRRAAKFRKERGLKDGGRYLAQSEVVKVKFLTALKISLTRPLIFLATEPIVMFFSFWVAIAWSVYYVQIAGLPYMMSRIYLFNTEQVGLVYSTMCIGAVIGMLGSQWQERIYRRMVPKKGVEARLYGPMVAGVGLAVGCYIVGFTALPNVHWIASAIGQTIVIASIMTIYVTAFTYVAECYGSYASSAMAGQSSARNIIGGVFAMTTNSMFKSMTVRWAVVMMGGVATVLTLVPFVAYFYGPQIRARSKYSRLLMQQEREAIESERYQREARGMDISGAEGVDDGTNDDDEKV